MKRIFLPVLALLMTPITACADKAIEFNKLPGAAQTFINTYFSDATIAITMVDYDDAGKTYDVTFTDGRTIEFDRKGNWQNVDCGQTQVPAGIVPAAIQTHVSNTYPDAFIVEINRDTRDWEVGLNNGLDLTYDLKFKLIELDN